MNVKNSHETSFIVIFLFLAAASIAFFNLNFFRISYVYSGRITDGINDAPLDLVKINVGAKTTYTNGGGQYSLTVFHPILAGPFSPKVISSVAIEPPYDYESMSSDVKCVIRKHNFLSTNFECSAIVYPQSINVASRILSEQVNSGLGSDATIRSRQERVWKLLSTNSKNMWGSESAFVGSSMTYEITRFKLGRQLVSYTISKNQSYLDSLNYLGKYPIDGNIAVVKATLNYKSGDKEDVEMYFLREDNIWKYLTQDTPEKFKSFEVPGGKNIVKE